MNVDHLYILRLVEDDTDGMVQHSAQALFYKNVMKTGTRTVEWYDIPRAGDRQLRLSYTPGGGVQQTGNADTQWAEKVAKDFAVKFKGNDHVLDGTTPKPAHRISDTIGAIVVCHSHNQKHTFSEFYTPEQLAGRLAVCLDLTLRMICFNSCNAAGKHGQTAEQLKKGPNETWESKRIDKTQEEQTALLTEYGHIQFPKKNKPATAGFMKKNVGDQWKKKTVFTDDGGKTLIDANNFSMVSRFLRQYVRDRNCTEKVIVAGYDEEITAAHPDKAWGESKSNDQIGKRIKRDRTFIHGTNAKIYFLAENGKNGIIQKVAQPDWAAHYNLPVEAVDQ